MEHVLSDVCTCTNALYCINFLKCDCNLCSSGRLNHHATKADIMLTQLSCATLHRYSAILQSWVEIIPPSRNLEQKLRNLTLYAKFNSTSTSQNACRYILFRQFIISNKCRDVRLKCLVYLGNSIKISPFYPSIFLSCPPRFAVATLVLTLLSPSKDR